MSLSPSPAKQSPNSKPEHLSVDAILSNVQRNLYHSTVSLELSRAEQNNLINSRVSQFCQQQKLIAQKDIRIQELLIEISSYKDQTSFFINQLQQTINELLNNNRILETEITDLLKQKQLETILVAEKDQLIEEIMAKSVHGSILIGEKIKDESLYESLAEEESSKQKEAKQEVNNVEENAGHSDSKQSILSELSQKCQSSQQGIPKDRLGALVEKERLLSLLLQQASKLFSPSQEQDLQLSEQPQQFIISTFLKELKELKELKGFREQIKGLKELSQRQAINIVDLEKVVEQQICQRRQILDQRNRLRDSLDLVQKGTSHNLSFDELNKKLMKAEEQKKSAEFELFKLRMNQQEQKNTASLDLRRMVQSIGEEERENNNSPSTIEERAESEEESTRNSVVIGLNLKIGQLQELLDGKDARLIELEDRYKNYTQNFAKIFELSVDFNNTFCPFVEDSISKRGQIYGRIQKHLQEKFAVERKIVELSNGTQSLPANGAEYCESLLPSTVVSELI